MLVGTITGRTLTGATIPGQSRPGRDEGVFHIPQSSSITGTSPSDCFVSYPGHSLGVGGGSYLSTKKQLVYSIAPAEWVMKYSILRASNTLQPS